MPKRRRLHQYCTIMFAGPDDGDNTPALQPVTEESASASHAPLHARLGREHVGSTLGILPPAPVKTACWLPA